MAPFFRRAMPRAPGFDAAKGDIWQWRIAEPPGKGQSPRTSHSRGWFGSRWPDEDLVDE
jgi:hypothetical protein